MVKQIQKCIFAKEIMTCMTICAITACSIHRHDTYRNNKFDIMCKTVGTIDINNIKKDNDIMGILCKYINEHTQYNTFAIIELPIARLEGDNRTGVFIGPGYKPLYDDIYNTKILGTIDIKGTKTYIISYNHNCNILKNNWQNTNPTDSIIKGNYSNRVSYYADENFLWRALYVYKQDGEYNTIDRLDTVMFVKEVPSSIQFSRPVVK